MDKTIEEPRLVEEGIFFTMTTGFIERECLVSKNALAHLCRVQGHTMTSLNTYRAFEAKIHSVARRLVVAGESQSPLVLGTAYFLDVGRSAAS